MVKHRHYYDIMFARIENKYCIAIFKDNNSIKHFVEYKMDETVVVFFNKHFELNIKYFV